jgi:hypothetical protein
MGENLKNTHHMFLTKNQAVFLILQENTLGKKISMVAFYVLVLLK